MDYIDVMIRIRKDANMTQGQLAQRLGWSRPQIARYETRISIPTIKYLIAFCNEMKVNPDKVLRNELIL